MSHIECSWDVLRKDDNAVIAPRIVDTIEAPS